MKFIFELNWIFWYLEFVNSQFPIRIHELRIILIFYFIKIDLVKITDLCAVSYGMTGCGVFKVGIQNLSL